jgi:tRNA(fMet)-specific endonuclease VapC
VTEDPLAGHGLLDTSTVVLLERIADPSELPEVPLITTVTLAELSVGPLVTDDPGEQATRQVRLQQAESDFDPLPFDAAAARSFGQVAASLHRAGRKSRARAFDAMIAAIALSNRLPLFTCNPADFGHIDDLDLRSVRHPDTVG